MDLVFKALADPSRRTLLDALAADDGLSVNDLCATCPDLSRFGVMKHLGVLEEAHLVTTQREGRRKLHYLNPVPIQIIHDRWISRFVAPFAQAMADLTVNPPRKETNGTTDTQLRDVHPGDTG